MMLHYYYNCYCFFLHLQVAIFVIKMLFLAPICICVIFMFNLVESSKKQFKNHRAQKINQSAIMFHLLQMGFFIIEYETMNKIHQLLEMPHISQPLLVFLNLA